MASLSGAVYREQFLHLGSYLVRGLIRIDGHAVRLEVESVEVIDPAEADAMAR